MVLFFRRRSQIEGALKKYFDKSETICLDKKFAVIVPSYPSGCPGKYFEPCPIREAMAKDKHQACRDGAKQIAIAMQTAFGTGNTTIRAVGNWYNPDTKRIERERGIKIETKYKKSCLTKEKSRDLIEAIDNAMAGLCQSQWYIETDKDAKLINTGKRKR